MVPAISINHVSKSYGQLQALKDIDFTIAQGEFFGLLGPNGAGKSTLISALAGLLRVNAGQLQVLGHDVQRDFRSARMSLGVVPQEITFDPFFNVEEALQYQSGYFGLRKNQQWIETLMENLSLTDKRHANLRQLSGGMRRRLLIGLALVHKPDVLLLDEPTAGVDVELRQSMWRFIRQLHKEGTTIVLTTHYLEEAETLCDRIGIINKGELIALEDKQQLLARGLGSQLSVQVDNSLVKIPEQLQSKLISTSDEEILFTFNRDQDQVMEILDLLRDAGNDIKQVSVKNDSLEDVFVQLTGMNEGVAS